MNIQSNPLLFNKSVLIKQYQKVFILPHSFPDRIQTKDLPIPKQKLWPLDHSSSWATMRDGSRESPDHVLSQKSPEVMNDLSGRFQFEACRRM